MPKYSKSKVLERLAATDNRIAEYSCETDSGDGHWLYLKPGWNWSMDHIVRGETVSEVLRDFREIEECPQDCPCRKK